jgi:hypothetical protein
MGCQDGGEDQGRGGVELRCWSLAHTDVAQSLALAIAMGESSDLSLHTDVATDDPHRRRWSLEQHQGVVAIAPSRPQPSHESGSVNVQLLQ